MARRNPFVKMGRPKAAPKTPLAPTEGLKKEVPAKAFKDGGHVGGYRSMPSHHDCPAMNDFKRKDS